MSGIPKQPALLGYDLIGLTGQYDLPMGEIESVWDRFPGYAIDLVPWSGRGRAQFGGVVVAESDACLIVKESDHSDQLYFPINDVTWEHFTETDLHTVCPFKGEADYWSLSVDDTIEENVAWTYQRPLDEVAGLEGYVGFYTARVQLELLEAFANDGGAEVAYRFPVWGTAADLVDLIDVKPDGEGRFASPSFPDPPMGTFFDIPDRHRPRQVVEGGHLLGQAIMAASNTVPDQRVVSASMVFTRAARFDAPLAVDVEVLRRGRTYSTVQTRTVQNDKLCSVGLVLLDSGAVDIAFHDDADTADWHLYENLAIYAGRGQVQGQGRIFSQDGRLVASYSLHAMVRSFDTDPTRIGGYTSAM